MSRYARGASMKRPYLGFFRPENGRHPALECSRLVAFIVAGDGKREILDRVLSGDARTPDGRLRPIGDTLWLVDRAAAGRWY
ncbi:MAG TPA: hypothetical protein VLW88_05210 [Hyphomicrobium sp.]|nr:hypothetical protein [Hyphomicrobium sp.]